MLPVIDPHVHLWDAAVASRQAWRPPSMSELARGFGRAELTATLDDDVHGVILVEAIDEPAENRRLGAATREIEQVLGAIAWLPLRDSTAARSELDELLEGGWARGVRCLLGRDPLSWLQEEASTFEELARAGLCWEVSAITGEQRTAIADLADRIPELTIVVGHLAGPPLGPDAGVGSQRWDAWEREVLELGRRPNVVLKLAVGLDALVAGAGWPLPLLRPAVEHVLHQAGASRCMIASNWPVVNGRRDRRGAYADMVDLVRALGAGANECFELCAGTASRTYGVGPTADGDHSTIALTHGRSNDA